MNYQKNVALICVAVASISCGKAEGDDTLVSRKHGLVTQMGMEKWPTSADGYVHIPVCFKQAPGFAQPPAYALGWVKNAILRSWNTVSNVRFEGLGMCAAGGGPAVVVLVKDDPSATEAQGNALGGPGALRYPDDVVSDATSSANFALTTANMSRKRIEYLAVHEMGHILGFHHEDARPDRPGPGKPCPRAAENPDPSFTNYLSVYDQESTMNYCSGNDSGQLTDIDVQAVQAYYAPNPDADADGDGIPNYADNCPYAANYDQQNSNFEAELVIEQRTNLAADGHVPTAASSPAYVDDWHNKFRGDACDRTPVVRTTVEYMETSTTGNACGGGSGGKMVRRSVVQDGWRSSIIGTRQASKAVGHTAICRCELLSPSLCALSQAAQCAVGDDSKFPDVAPVTSYKKMSNCASTPIAPIATLDAPSAAWGVAPATTPAQIWNENYDAAQFGVAPNTFAGTVWTHARPDVDPYSNLPKEFPKTGYSNHYDMVDSTPLTLTTSFQVPNPCDNCRIPWDQHLNFNANTIPPLLVFGTDGLQGKVPVHQFENRYQQARARYASSALSAFNIAATEVFTSGSNGALTIRGREPNTGVLLSTGKGFIRGVFSLGTNGKVAYTGATGHPDANVATPIRVFVPSEGAGGALFTMNGSTLKKQDVAAALSNAPTLTTTTMTTHVPLDPRAAAWDVATRALYVLDVVGTTSQRLRLVRVKENGDAKALWQSAFMPPASMPSKFFVQTTTSGHVFIAVSFATTSSWALLRSSSGTAVNSGSWNEPLASAPILTESFLAAPFVRTTGVSQYGPYRVVSTPRPQLELGVCAAPWLKDFIPSEPCDAGWNGTSPPGTEAPFICGTL